MVELFLFAVFGGSPSLLIGTTFSRTAKKRVTSHGFFALPWFFVGSMPVLGIARIKSRKGSVAPLRCFRGPNGVETKRWQEPLRWQEHPSDGIGLKCAPLRWTECEA